MKNQENQYIIPILIPYIKIPKDCIFHSQDNIETNKIKSLTKQKVKKIIDEYLKNQKEENISKEVVFYGGDFTKLDTKIQEELLEAVYEYIEQKKIDSIVITASPEDINKELLKKLKKYKVKTIELNAQSTNNYILNRAGIKHTFEDITKASKLIKWNGLKLGYQMLVGLPESTRLDELNTAKELIKFKPKTIKIFPVLVLNNTILQKEYEEGTYEPINMNQAVETCKELVYLFNRKKIRVTKIGLQDTDFIKKSNSGESKVIAGPYDEAFGQLVLDSIWYDSIVDKIKTFNVKVKEVEIKVNPLDEISVLGYNNENATKLKNVYEVDIKVKTDENIKPGKSEIEILKTFTDFREEEKLSK